MTAMTATALVTKAYQDAQIVARGVALTTAQETDGLERLTDVINFAQTQGMKVFLETEQTVTLVESQQAYTFMPSGDVNIAKPLEVKAAAYWDANDVSRSIDVISRDEWTRLSDRTQEGSVNQCFAETSYDRITLYVWNIPDATAATGTLRVVLRTQCGTPALISSTVVFPPEWALYLRWAVADELATGMPDSVQKRCASRMVMYKQALEDWDVENTQTYFQPDTRATQGSRFR